MASTALQIDALYAGLNDSDTGQSYSGAIVGFFEAGTTTPKAVWLDKDKTLPTVAGQTQVTLDSNGVAQVFGDGVYKINIYAPTDTGLVTPLAGSIDGAEYIVRVDKSNTPYDSIADMRAGTGGATDGALYNVLGYTTPGDGGGDPFYWDATSTDADDEASTIKVTSIATGRFKRLYSLPLDVRKAGAVLNGTTDDSAAISAADALGPVLIPGSALVSMNTVLSNAPVFVDGGYIIVATGDTLTTPCPDDTDNFIFDVNGTLTFTTMNKPINYLWFKGPGESDADAFDHAIAAAKTLQQIKVYNQNGIGSVDLDGATISKRVHVKGSGRIGGFIEGSINVTSAGAQSMFSDIGFRTPTSGALFDVAGRGGMDFRDCNIDPGTGNFVFSWDRDGQIPIIIEFMRCNLTSGQLLNAIGSVPRTYEVHFKEGSLIAIDEDEWLDADSGNYCSVVMYNTLASIGPGVTFIATSLLGLMTVRESSIDDNTAGVFATNGTGTWDTFDMSTSSMSTATSYRQEFIKSLFYGNGVTVDKYRTMLTTGSLAIDANRGIEEYFFDGSGDVTLTANVVYSVTGGLYDGQEITVYFIDRTIPGGFNCDFFGIVGAGWTIDKTVLRLKYINGNWEVYRIGDKTVV